jgi:hypothetical protein
MLYHEPGSAFHSSRSGRTRDVGELGTRPATSWAAIIAGSNWTNCGQFQTESATGERFWKLTPLGKILATFRARVLRLIDFMLVTGFHTQI